MGTERLDDGVATIPQWAPALGCTHLESAGLHADICAWAEEWAKRLISGAPAQTDAALEHPALSLSRLRMVGIFDSIPERMRTCRMADPLLVDRAIHHLTST